MESTPPYDFHVGRALYDLDLQSDSWKCSAFKVASPLYRNSARGFVTAAYWDRLWSEEPPPSQVDESVLQNAIYI